MNTEASNFYHELSTAPQNSFSRLVLFYNVHTKKYDDSHYNDRLHSEALPIDDVKKMVEELNGVEGIDVTYTDPWTTCIIVVVGIYLKLIIPIIAYAIKHRDESLGQPLLIILGFSFITAIIVYFIRLKVQSRHEQRLQTKVSSLEDIVQRYSSTVFTHRAVDICLSKHHSYISVTF